MPTTDNFTTNNPLTPEQIGHVCHVAIRGYQEIFSPPGFPVTGSLREFGAYEQLGIIRGVHMILAGATSEDLHESWCQEKRARGWKYGPIKDEVARTHPCLCPYADLPEMDRVKDRLFHAIVRVLSGRASQ